MVGPFERMVSTSDCALLVAVPLTVEEFESDVLAAVVSDTSKARGDYAFGMARNVGVQGAWNDNGKRIAELCECLIDDARRLGFRYVSARATGHTFAQAFGSGATVVLIVAHWREPGFIVASDLRAETPELVEKIAADTSDEFCVRLAMHRPSRPYTASDESATRFARDWLLGFIGSFNERDLDGACDELDRRLAGSLVPGNCLELRDGYHKADTLVGRIPSEWAGIVDLGVCHSLRLAQSLKDNRDDRAILTNEHARYPDRCIPEMRETVHRLAAEPCQYIYLRSEIFKVYSALAEKD